MKKTISITINRMVFNIEEDAYETLNAYLDALKKHFSLVDDGMEVVSDIESRISEQFASHIHDRKSEVVTLAEVQKVIDTMGSVEDLTGSEGGKNNNNAAPEAPGRRRLYRNPDDQIIAGVASGIASYFNIDPLIPRVLLIVSAFIGGYGILLYLILWIIVPEAQSAADKLEMKGAAVNITNLQESLKDKGTKQNFSVIRYFFKEIFYLLGRLLRTLGPIILTILGLLLTAVSFVALFAFSLLTLLLLFNPNSPYIDPAIAQVFNGSQYILLVSSGFVSVIIPTLVALLVGVSFIRRKNVLKPAVGTTLAVLWLAGGLTFAYLATSSAPQIDAAVKSIQERPQVSQVLSVSEFSSIVASSDQMVKVTYGTQTQVIAYGRDKDLEQLNVYVKNNVLNIEHKDEFNFCLICINRPVTVEIITPNLSKVTANNASRIEVKGFNQQKTFKATASNAGRIDFTGEIIELSVVVNNAGRVSLNGKADTVDANLSNAGRLDATEFIAKAMTIDAKNSSHADINVTETLHAIASGASQIKYTGDPKVVELDESNAAQITPQ